MPKVGRFQLIGSTEDTDDHESACAMRLPWTTAVHHAAGPAGVGVHARGGLIQKHHAGAAQEGDGHAQLPSLPAGELLSPCVALLLKACTHKPLFNGCLRAMLTIIA